MRRRSETPHPRRDRAQSRTPRCRKALVLGIVSGVVAAVALALLFSLSCRPAWYLPAAVDFTRLDADKDALVRLADDISRAFNTGRWFECSLTQHQINRWIAARTRMWPGAERWDIPGIENPYVSLFPGRVRLAARLAVRGLSAVASLDLHATIERDRIVLAAGSAGIGALSFPAGWLMSLLSRFRDEWARRGIELLPAGAAFKNDFVWKNGQRRFRVDVVEVGEGVIHLRFELLP